MKCSIVAWDEKSHYYTTTCKKIQQCSPNDWTCLFNCPTYFMNQQVRWTTPCGDFTEFFARTCITTIAYLISVFSSVKGWTLLNLLRIFINVAKPIPESEAKCIGTMNSSRCVKLWQSHVSKKSVQRVWV